MGTISITIAFLTLGWLAVKFFTIGRREKGLPPGPPTIPLLGNLHVFPTEFAHYKFTEWARQYGDIYSLKIGSGTAIVLSSATAVKELMDKRSGNTVDRPANHMSFTVQRGYNMVMAGYTDTWRVIRKTAYSILTPHASAKHVPIQTAEAKQMLYDFLHTPQDFYNHVRRTSNSVIMSVLYGKRCPRYETREATAFFEVQHIWEMVLEPGAHPPVDLLPFLKYVPERWAPWKTLCNKTRKMQRALYFGLLAECEERLAKGEENGCFMDEVIKGREQFGLDREMLAYLGGVLIEGGSDTTANFIQSLILILTAFPEAQRKAQEEIDRVVGGQRMPVIANFDDLPYVQAVIKETHRFRPVAPLMIPHATLKPDVYLEYLIPQGSTIFVNLWGINNDAAVFEEPEIFRPERYLLTEFGTKLGVDDKDFRESLTFGVGRRICPGRHLAHNTLMIATMNLLWAFEFAPATDPATGAAVPVDTFAYEKGVLSTPKPFPCKITPRSKERAEIIEREFLESIETFVKFEQGLDSSDREWVDTTRPKHQ